MKEGKESGKKSRPRKSVERYAQFFELAPVAYLTLDESGTVCEANRAALNLLRISREELLRKSFSFHMNAEVKSVFIAHVKKTFESGEKQTCELSMKPKADIPLWVRLESVAVSHPEGRGAVCMTAMTNIAERRHAEEQLGRIKDELEETFDAIEDPLCLMDVNGHILRCNQSFAGYIKKPFGHIVGRPFSEVIEARAPLFSDLLKRMKETRSRESISFEASGSFYSAVLDPMLDKENCLAGAVCIISDITERKLSEKDLVESKRRIELLSMTAVKLLESENYHLIIKEVCNRVLEYLDCQVFFNYLLDEKSQRLKLNACAGITEDALHHIEWMDYGAGFEAVPEYGVPVIAESSEPRDPLFDPMRVADVKAYACYPLLSQGKVIGTLSFGSRAKSSFSREDLAIMKTVTDQVAIGMERIRFLQELERKVEERTSELEEVNRRLQSEIVEHERTSADLRIERFKLLNILESMENGVCIINDTYDMQYINPAMEKEFGPVERRKCYRYLHDLESICSQCNKESILSGNSMKIEKFFVKTGKTYELFGTPLLNSDGTISKLEIFHDITDRKRAEKALHDSHELLERAFSNIHILVAQLDRNFNYIRVNRAYAAVNGKEPEFFMGMNHFALYPDEEREMVFRRVIDTCEPVFFYEKPFRHAGSPEEGTAYWDWSLQPIKSMNGEVESLVFSLIDRTRHHISQEKLAKSEKKYRSLVEQAADAIIIIDRELMIIDVNSTACAMSGFSREELLRMDVRDLLHLQGYDEDPLRTAELMAGETLISERKALRRDGSLIDIEISGRMLDDGNILAIIRDITGRKEEERRDRFTTELLELFVKQPAKRDYLESVVRLIGDWTEFSNVGIRIVDDDGCMPYASYAGFSSSFMQLENMLSMDADTCACVRVVTGRFDRQDASVVTPGGSFVLNDSGTFINSLSEQEKTRFRGNCAVNGFLSIAIIPIRFKNEVIGIVHMADKREGMIARKNVQFMETVASPLIGEAIHRFNVEEEVLSARDELEGRVQERTAELKRMAEELARSNADLQQFAYAASHDLQEPLRGIEGFVKLFERRYKGKIDQRGDEYIEYIVDGVKRMKGLIIDLLEYSRAGRKSEKYRLYDSSLALALALSNLGRTIKESHADVTNDELPFVFADPSQLASLFQNLIGNAIKFRSAERPRIHVSACRKEDEWLFSFRDNGIGIDPRYFERIFAVFQRLHVRSEYPGSGIGLALCKRIVELHGGHIWVESEPGKGTVFFFTMPVHDDQGGAKNV